MDNIDYRQECINMWEWIAQQPDYTTKEDWIEQFPEKAIMLNPTYNCFACDFAIGFLKSACSLSCPVKWIENSSNIGNCLEEGSVYKIWEDETTQKNAKKVLKRIKDTWKECK